MATSYTSLLGLALPVTGELSGTWGDTVNDYITQYVDAAVEGTQTISGSQTAVTLSTANGTTLSQAGSGATGSAQYAVINCTGNPGGLLTITVPNSSRNYIVINSTSTSQSVKVVGTGPTTGVTLVSGEKAVIAWNGSDFIKVASTVALPAGSTTQVQYNNAGALAGSANLTFDGSNLQIGSQGDLRLGDSDNSNWVAFQAPATVASNVTWTLPSTDGTNGQALTTNGSGTLAFATVGASAATPTALGTVYGSTPGGTPFNAVLGYQAFANNSNGVASVAVGYQAGYTQTTNNSGFVTLVGYQAGYTTSGSNTLTAVGYKALYANSTGSLNNAFGYLALTANTTGNYNSAFGDQALASNTTASYNTAVGYQAGYSNTTGQQSVAVGYQALYSTTTAGYSTAVGYQAGQLTTSGIIAAFGQYVLRSNTTGNANCGFGGYDGTNTQTLAANTTGSNNSAFGMGALANNTTASYNDAVGYRALYSNTTGTQNHAFGAFALNANTTASFNTAIGYQVLRSNTTGARNIAIGDESAGNTTSAMDANTTGSNNVAVGNGALRSNTTASYNTAVGYEAGYSNTTGLITAVGSQALNSNTTGAYNVAVGGYTVGSNYAALTFNTTGSNNTAVGIGALQANTTASDNTALGYQALYASTGAQNTGIGANALDSVTTGTNNVGVGYLAGAAITTGSTNIAVGKENLQSLTTGSYNTHIGYATTAGAAGRANAIVICSGPNGATDKGDDTGFINANGGGNYAGNNSSSWSTTSDFRLKKNIVDNDEGIDKIMGIRVRNFEYRLPEEVDPALKPSDAIKRPGVQLGVIAQELQQVCPDCVKEESTGVLSVDSDNVFWHMVNAIKQLNAKVEALQAEITTLKGA